MEKKRVVQYILVILIIAVLTGIVYGEIKELLPFWNPLLDEKTRLVRYYTCSLAICARGCGSEEVESICLEVDPRTRECTEWCQDICEENAWTNEKHCGEDYKIDITLKSPIALKGGRNDNYDTEGMIGWRVNTEAYEISKELNKTPGFLFLNNYPCDSQKEWEEWGPGEDGISKYIMEQGYTESCHEGKRWGGCTGLHNCGWCKCGYFYRALDYYVSIVPGTLHLINERDIREFGTGVAYGGGTPKACIGSICFAPGYFEVNSHGIGAILMTPDDALEWQCFTHYPVCQEGYYECKFKGEISMYTKIPCIGGMYAAYPDYSCDEKLSNVIRDAESLCPDVFFERTDEPFTGGFNLWVEHEGKEIEEYGEVKIPIEQKADFEVFIKNNLGFDEESSFDLKVLYPEDANCSFVDDEDQVSISIEDGEQDSKGLTCEPIKPGTYPIRVIGWWGGGTHSRQFNLVVGDFDVRILMDEEPPEEPVEILIGGSKTFDVDIKNKLGDEAKFKLSLSSFPDPEINCALKKTSLTVDDGETGRTSFTCTPKEDAGGVTYTVTVTGTYEGLDRKNSTVIKVSTCDVTDFKLEILKGGSSTSTLDSDDEFKLKVSGFSGCDGNPVDFSISLLTDDGESVGEWDVGETTTEGDDAIYPKLDDEFLHAGSPGDYIFHASANFDGDVKYDDVGFTIEPGSPGRKFCHICKDEEEDDYMCVFSLGTVDPLGCDALDICEHDIGCPCWGWPIITKCAVDCKFSCDPQSCNQTEKGCAKTSNICCKSDSNYYSYGPSAGTPCLSPDKYTDNSLRSEFWWNGVDNARNVLVWDNDVDFWCDTETYLCKSLYERNSYATFKNNFCNKDEDCEASDPDVPLDAQCIDIPSSPDEILYEDLRDEFTGKKACRLKSPFVTDDDWYTSWLFIRISSSSRPVYGIKIVFRSEFKNDVERRGNNGRFELFLHKEAGDWFKVSSPAPGIETHGTRTEVIFNIKPSDEWSWEDIDAMLIGYKYGWQGWLEGIAPPYTPKHGLSNGWIDYMGLITKDPENTTFCTDRPEEESDSSPFYRVVDNGWRCYWGLNCLEKELEGKKGWVFEGPNDGIKPLQSLPNVCSCWRSQKSMTEKEDHTCGKGFCGFKNDGKLYCYNGTKCAHGGWWPDSLRECKDDEICTSEGCKPES